MVLTDDLTVGDNADVVGSLTVGDITSDSTVTATTTVTGADVTATDDMSVGDNLGVTGLATVGETLEVTGAITAKSTTEFQGVPKILDDIALTFGTNDDATLKYDETTTDRLLYAGAGFRFTDDDNLEFGSDGDATIHYDETTDDDLEITCSKGIVVESATVFDSTVDVDGAADFDAAVTFSDVPKVEDNIALTLGTDSDATIKYDETTDDDLEITCANGIAIESATTFDSTVGFSGIPKVADDIALTLGTGDDATITYDETTDDALEIACSGAGGIVFKSAAKFDSTILVNAAPTIVDDVSLTLGTGSDATIKYDEATDDDLEITCANGIAIESATTFDTKTTFSGAIIQSTIATDIDYTVTDTGPNVVFCGNGAAHQTITLPTAADNTGRIIYVIIVTAPGEFNVIIDGENAETVDQAATKTSTGDEGDMYELICDGDEWQEITHIGTWS
jgi:hypothetical protein